MQLALNLLVTALRLKVALLGLPIEYKALVDQAMPIAEMAISTAQQELQKPATPVQTEVTTTPVVTTQPTTPVQTQVITAPTPVVITQPSFGSITNNVPQIMKEIIVKNEKNEIVDAVTVPASVLSVFLNVDYKENGKSTLETIVATTDENVTRTFAKNERACGFSSMGGAKDDCSTNYLYRITAPGLHSVTFTVGDTTKTVNINVE